MKIDKEANKYNDWLHQIQIGWQVKLIKRDFEVKLGKMLQQNPKNKEDTEEYYVRSTNVMWDGVDLSGIKKMWFSSLDKASIRLSDGDLLVCEGGDVGRSCVWHNELEECYIQNAINRVRPHKNASTRFLYYWMFLLKHLGFIDAFVSRITIAHLTAEKLERIPIALPSNEEQIRIAEYLDQACSVVDSVISIKKQQLEKLSQLGGSIISRVVVEGLSGESPKEQVDSIWFEKIPRGWSLKRLKDVVSIQTGITLGKEYEGDLIECPYLRVANVQDGYLDLKDVKSILIPKRDVKRYLLKPNDVLMTEGGDLDKLGRGHVWHGEIVGCLHQNHVFAIRCDKSKLLPDFLAFLTGSKHGRNYFEITGKKTTNLASTNSTKVGQFPVPLPPVDEQRQIIQYLKSELLKIENIMTGVGQQIEVLNEYKKSLIHECVTGKRRITEADLQKVA